MKSHRHVSHALFQSGSLCEWPHAVFPPFRAFQENFPGASACLTHKTTRTRVYVVVILGTTGDIIPAHLNMALVKLGKLPR